MKNRKQLFKYLISLLIFGMNGIVSNQIAMTSEQIVLSRTIIGGALLVILFFATRQQLHKEAIRRQWPVLLLSGAAMGLSWIFLFGLFLPAGGKRQQHPHAEQQGDDSGFTARFCVLHRIHCSPSACSGAHSGCPAHRGSGSCSGRSRCSR